jgi:hypothetical protein
VQCTLHMCTCAHVHESYASLGHKTLCRSWCVCCCSSHPCVLLTQTGNMQWVLPDACFTASRLLKGQDEADVRDWPGVCTAAATTLRCAAAIKKQQLFTCRCKSLSTFAQIQQARRAQCVCIHACMCQHAMQTSRAAPKVANIRQTSDVDCTDHAAVTCCICSHRPKAS